MIITIDRARRHWRDRSAECNRRQWERDQVMRHYQANYYAADHGRRWRGRLLARAEAVMVAARRACPECSAWVLWASCEVLPGRGVRKANP